MTRNGGGGVEGKNKKSSNAKNNRVSVEIKDLKFEPVIPGEPVDVETKSKSEVEGNEISSSGSNKLEKILSELESGCLAAEDSTESKSCDAVGYLKKKMATLGFQAGIQLSGAGAYRDARKILEGFPGDDEYELTFEEVESSDEFSGEEEDDEDEEVKEEIEDEEFEDETDYNYSYFDNGEDNGDYDDGNEEAVF